MTVNDVVPGPFSYSPVDMDLTLNQAMTPNTVSPGGGAVTSWEIEPDVPNGLNFGSNNGTIWGTPMVLQISPITYTIWANNTGGSSSTTVTITIIDAAPGPFEYIPENNTITNNSLVHLAPYFIDTTSGNGSTWQVATQNNPGVNFELVVNDIIYFDANQNKRLYAFNPVNNTVWQVNSSLTGVGQYMAYAIDDVLYFSAFGAGLGNEFWAYNTTNNTAWQVADINPGTGSSNSGNWLNEQSGELIFFRANTGSAWKLHVFNASNQTVWEVSHSFSQQFGYSGSSKLLSKAIGDTLYFAAKDSSSPHYEPFAYTVSNNTVWMIADIYSGSASYGTEAGQIWQAS